MSVWRIATYEVLHGEAVQQWTADNIPQHGAFATPDTYVPEAFFVHERDPQPLVRWVDAGGQAYDGYQPLNGAAYWDEATVAARRQALASQPGTADLIDPGH